jgi:redox-sensing transcriptional repressor
MSQPPFRSPEQPGQPVPKAVVSRLSLYLRELQSLLRAGRGTTSSTELGRQLGFSNAQVRKDLAYFGQFGYPGVGYRCDELIAAIKKILGTSQEWPVALMGMGNLGRALLGYRGFANQGFRIVAAYDSDPEKQGATIDRVPVFAPAQLPHDVALYGIRLAILAVPATSAQTVAEEVATAGITGILNFSPVTLSLPATVHIIGVDLAIELEQLAFAVVNGPARGDQALPGDDGEIGDDELTE